VRDGYDAILKNVRKHSRSITIDEMLVALRGATEGPWRIRARRARDRSQTGIAGFAMSPQRTPLIIDRIVTHAIHIPYPRTIHWGAHSESGADYLIVEIVTKDGLSGIAEGTVKINWNGATLRSLSVVIEEVFKPRLIGVDAADEMALAKTLRRIPEHRLAKSLIDVACWDLRAQAVGKPLWQIWGGDRNVPVSWTVTRQSPLDMAREAADKIAAHGFRMLKIKTGQGTATDIQALREIRNAVGVDIRMYADSNGAYKPDEIAAFTAVLKDEGVFLAEDPCYFTPDESFEQLRRSCAVPLMVDHDACLPLDATLFLDRGVEAISVKLEKSGLSESWDIVNMSKARGAKTHVGFLGETSLGANAALQLAAAIPDRKDWLPAEVTFFLTLPQEFVHAPLAIKDGEIRLQDEPSFGAMVDWKRVKELQP
jgi:L-alanine-DL-glutamate epimerase-like enolase superfamily enzyme